MILLSLVLACSTPTPPEPPVAAPTVVSLTDRLDTARVSGAQAPADRFLRVWTLGEGDGPWTALSGEDDPSLAAVSIAPAADRWTLTLDRPPQQRGPFWIGGVELNMDEPLAYGDFEAVHVRAHTKDRFAGITIVSGEGEEHPLPHFSTFFGDHDEAPPLFSDGSTQTYALPLRPRKGSGADGKFDWLGILAASQVQADVDILDITLVPRGASYAEGHAVTPVLRGAESRRTLYAHTDASLSWTLDLPPGARFDAGLTALPGESVAYTIRATHGEAMVEETHTVEGDGAWHQVSVDLGAVAGQRDVELTLEAAGPGEVAFWGAPTVSGTPAADRPPNVVFYVIDGGGADFMSLYGYGDETTPELQALAAEGVVFERAYSSSTWTQPSTASFMTSLHHSVLGGLRRGVHSTPIPDEAVTMAEHMRRGGYQTATFTSNPNAGRLIGTDRGADVANDSKTKNPSTSSHELHDRFWAWRDAYPGGPWWVHIQTTDVHEPAHPVAPYAGKFSDVEASQVDAWHDLLFQKAGHRFGTTSIFRWYRGAFEAAGLDSKAYYGAQRGLYADSMTHQDAALAKFVADLKARGEWENTLLIVGSDHGHPAATFARWGRGLIDPEPELWEGALLDSYAAHVPLIVVWPGHIEGGKRVAQPVSMIDVLPTILELAELPPAEVAQGRSLAPLLRGESLEPRPVILDEFRVDEVTGEMIGNLELVDGDWGASLEIGPTPEGTDPTRGRHDIPAGGRWGAVHPFTPEPPRLLLYDLKADPLVTHSVHADHPDLVAKYTKVLEEHWAANQALGQRYVDADAQALDPEQLQQLKELGYVQ